MAISGHEELDVRSIDPDTLTVWGVRPLRVQSKDVSTAYFPENPWECGPAGRDGFPDLMMVFDPRAIARAIEALLLRPSGLLEGEWVHLGVIGSLKSEAGGERIRGGDFTVFHRSK